jgi:hypothetical protein
MLRPRRSKKGMLARYKQLVQLELKERKAGLLAWAKGVLK